VCSGFCVDAWHGGRKRALGCRFIRKRSTYKRISQFF
jgi:hypothetical protein